jgi:hypothetical protein
VLSRKTSFHNRSNHILHVFLSVHFLRISFFFVLSLALSLVSKGQDQEPGPRRGSRIIDDSTKSVYGPRTSKYYYEMDDFFNRTVLYPIDTVIKNVHRINSYVRFNNNLYQDLGNTGTAIQPLFYKVPGLIGSSSGFTSYDLYWDTEAVRYYDTKSPYTNIKIILGGRGKSMTRVSFSRNINRQWNFGFTYRALLIDKQIQRTGKGDRHVKGTYLDLHLAYQSKDSTYRMFTNFRNNRHEVDEYGGVNLAETEGYKDFYSKNAIPWLTEASSLEKRNNYHLHHRYQIARALQIYHTLDSYHQNNSFYDDLSKSPAAYYDNIVKDTVLIDSVHTHDNAIFKSFRNEVGIKGNLLKLFYNGYYAIRRYDMDYKYIMEDTLFTQMKGIENYIGGRISMKLDSVFELTAWGEIMQTGNYRIDAQLKSKWLEASLKQVQYAPSSLQQAYRGSHDLWDNDFRSVNVTQLNGYLHYTTQKLDISPGLTFSTLTNYVFFKEGDYGPNQKQKVLPVQSSGTQVVAAPELRFSFTFLKDLSFSSQTIYNAVLKNDDAAIQVPDLFINAQLAYQKEWFKNNLDMQVGFDVHWQSSYTPNGYDIVTQQFYVQQAFSVPGYPIVDVFFNGRIKKARLFVKYNNILQLFTQEGYMPTPNYPAARNTLDFGVDWSFYD